MPIKNAARKVITKTQNYREKISNKAQQIIDEPRNLRVINDSDQIILVELNKLIKK